MFCRNCGNQLDDKAIMCPHCGVFLDEREAKKFTKPVESEGKRVNGLGIAAFVVGLASLGLGEYFLIVSIVAFVLGIVAVVKRKNYTSCNGLAIAGLVISIVSILIWVVILGVYGLAFLSFLSGY